MQRELLKSKLPQGQPKINDTGCGARAGLKRRRDFTPACWEDYFESSHDVAVNETSTFRVYKAGSSGPVLFLLHGGGFSALSWSLFAVKVTAMSNCQVLAVDCRGHGDTRTPDNMNLSIETLTNDVYDVIEAIYPDGHPPIILMGHSMGGAVAIHVAAQGLLSSLIALVVVDVVEGTALEGLSAMQSFLRGRPKTFSSLEKAIEWSIRSGQLRNLDSAKVSMQGQLVKCQSSAHDENELVTKGALVGGNHGDLSVISESEASDFSTEEKSSEVEKQTEGPKTADDCKYKWRINLSETEQFWKGWFSNMSRLFLSCPVPKLLLVAGRDRLDKELTLAHIQGKFQLHILTKCGHAVHEDDPDKVAEMLVAFMVRHKFAEPKDDFRRHMPCC